MVKKKVGYGTELIICERSDSRIKSNIKTVNVLIPNKTGTPMSFSLRENPVCIFGNPITTLPFKLIDSTGKKGSETPSCNLC